MLLLGINHVIRLGIDWQVAYGRHLSDRMDFLPSLCCKLHSGGLEDPLLNGQ